MVHLGFFYWLWHGHHEGVDCALEKMDAVLQHLNDVVAWNPEAVLQHLNDVVAWNPLEGVEAGVEADDQPARFASETESAGYFEACVSS